MIARDRHAELLWACASTAATCEMIAVELRHLQRTEVGEVLEGFKPGQKGSSAMPHKRNPISAETISGLARVVRSNLLAGLQDVALWHERDISHSSVERVILPDSTTLVHYSLLRLDRLLGHLVVDERRMLANVWSSHGLVFSQPVLLALVAAGLSRDDAYRVVQRNALAGVGGGQPSSGRCSRPTREVTLGGRAARRGVRPRSIGAQRRPSVRRPDGGRLRRRQSRRLIPAFFSTDGVDADLAPRRIRDALPLAIGLGDRDERLLDGGVVEAARAGSGARSRGCAAPGAA